MKLFSLTRTPIFRGLCSLSFVALVVSWIAYQFCLMFEWPLRLYSHNPLRQLTFGTDYDTNPVVSADGQSLWFVRRPEGTRQISEFEMDLTAHNQRAVKTSNGPAGLFPAFCPGSKLVYYEGQDGIRCMDQDKGTDRLICQGESPSVSSDGRFLASIMYVSRGKEQWLSKELWLMDVAGTYRHPVSHTDLGDFANLVFSAFVRHITSTILKVSYNKPQPQRYGWFHTWLFDNLSALNFALYRW